MPIFLYPRRASEGKHCARTHACWTHRRCRGVILQNTWNVLRWWRGDNDWVLDSADNRGWEKKMEKGITGFKENKVINERKENEENITWRVGSREGQEMSKGESSKMTGKGMIEKDKKIQTRKGWRKNGMKDRTEERTRKRNRPGIGEKYPRKERWKANKVNGLWR